MFCDFFFALFKFSNECMSGAFFLICLVRRFVPCMSYGWTDEATNLLHGEDVQDKLEAKNGATYKAELTAEGTWRATGWSFG